MRHAEAAASPRSAKERILDAAVRRFCRQSYEQTGLREIAADVGVDVAYVHRCYGSKRGLFSAAVKAVMQWEDAVPEAGEDFAARLAEQIQASGAEEDDDQVKPLDIFVHSLSSPEASEVLRAQLQDYIVEPLASRLDPPDANRAALIAAFAMGFLIMKKVVRIEPLLEAKSDDLTPEITRVIDELIKGAHAPSKKSASG